MSEGAQDNMSSLKAIFAHAPAYTQALYLIEGKARAVITSLPMKPSLGSVPAESPQFQVRFLRQRETINEIVNMYELVVLLASLEPPIPSERGWTVGKPSDNSV